MKAGMGAISAAAATQGESPRRSATMVAKVTMERAQPEDAGDHLHRSPRRFALGLLQLVVVGGVLEVGQIERGGVAHDLELDVDGQPFLQQLLADVAGGLQEAGAQEQDELEHGEDDDGADMLITTARLHPRDDLVDETASQPDLRRGGDALQ